LGLPIKLDTNGMRPEVVEDVLDFGLVQVVAVDVKGPFEMYPALTGGAVSAADAAVNLTRIFSLAARRPHSFLFRLTKVPVLAEEDVSYARSCLPRGFDLSIQQYQAPRRTHAFADHEAGRPTRDLVH
jgi:pyruvate formate lyase activating enzyme